MGNFGQAVRRLRTIRRLSRKDLAALSGLSVSLISKMENDLQQNLRPETKMQILDALHSVVAIDDASWKETLELASLPYTPPVQNLASRQVKRSKEREAPIVHWNKFLASINDPAEARAYQSAMALIDRVGAHPANEAIQAVSSCIHAFLQGIGLNLRRSELDNLDAEPSGRLPNAIVYTVKLSALPVEGAALATVAPASPQGKHFTHVTPPKHTELGVEQEYVDYERVEPEPAKDIRQQKRG